MLYHQANFLSLSSLLLLQYTLDADTDYCSTQKHMLIKLYLICQDFLFALAIVNGKVNETLLHKCLEI